MAREEGGSSFWYFLVGTAVGAGLGVLFAPKPGYKTREELADWLKERREQGSELLSKISDAIPEKKEQLASAVEAGKQALYGNSKHKHS